MTRLKVISAGPALTLQDAGRPGYLAKGLSRGGAADFRALQEAAKLLDQPVSAAVEMAGMGGKFTAPRGPITFALTGAPMRTKIDGQPIIWNATHRLETGQTLDIGPVEAGAFGYLSVAGGFDEPEFLGSRSAHLTAGIGKRISAGDLLKVRGGEARANMRLPTEARFAGGELRVLPSPQIEMFEPDVIARFFDTSFVRSPRGNRMGVELQGEGDFGAKGGLTAVSEMITPGDVQMTGAGAPFILGPECQTTGGYPRIATIIPPDLAIAMQAAPGTRLTFRQVSRDEALAALKVEMSEIAALTPEPAIRNPHDIADLLSYQLVDGVYGGDQE